MVFLRCPRCGVEEGSRDGTTPCEKCRQAELEWYQLQLQVVEVESPGRYEDDDSGESSG